MIRFRPTARGVLVGVGFVMGCGQGPTSAPAAAPVRVLTTPTPPAVAADSALDRHVLTLAAAVERCPGAPSDRRECAARTAWLADSRELATPLAQQTLWSLLEDPSETQRMLVLQRWSKVPPAAALQEPSYAARLLARARREPVEAVSVQLAEHVVRIETPDAAPEVQQLAQDHPRAAFRVALAHAWEHRDPSPLSFRALGTALSDVDPNVQLAAIQTLASERYADASEACGMLRTRMLSPGAYPGAALFAATRSHCPELQALASAELPNRLRDVNALSPRDATEYAMAARTACLDRGTPNDRRVGMGAARQLVKSRDASVRRMAGLVAAHCDADGSSTAFLRMLGRDTDRSVAESAAHLLAEQGHRTPPAGIMSIGLLSGVSAGSEPRLLGQAEPKSKPKSKPKPKP